MRRFLFSVCLFLFLSLFVSQSFGSLSSSPASVSSDNLILFERSTIDPSSPEFHLSSASSSSDVAHDSKGRSHYLLQFRPPLNQASREEIESVIGVPLVDYYPKNTFLVYIEREKAEAARSLPSVAWVGPYRSHHKVHSSVDQLDPVSVKVTVTVNDDGESEEDGFNKFLDEEDLMNERSAPLTELNVAVTRSLTGEELSQLASELSQLLHKQFAIHAEVTIPGRSRLHIQFESESDLQRSVSFLSARPEIKYFTRQPIASLHNRWSFGLTQSGFDLIQYTSQGNAREVLGFQHHLRGDGEVVGISDTGVDVNSCFFYDPNFPNGPPYKEYRRFDANTPITYSEPEDKRHRKIVQYVQFFGTDHTTDTHNHGHGTHTAGSVAGKFLTGASAYNGMAPDAKLAVFDMGTLRKLPSPLGENMLAWTYGAGARIHSNSWTAKEDFSYNGQAHEIDDFVFNHKDMLVVFSAANKGTQPAGRQLPAPATNKNGIAVGASMSSTQHWKEFTGPGGFQSNEEIYDLIDREPILFSSESLACFSSRGPTRDGRIKPDIVANGFYIVSAKNGQESSASCSNEPADLLRALPGTSQSAPTVAGLAAVVREYFKKGFYPAVSVEPHTENAFNPSAALVKAMIVASGRKLTGVVDKACAVLNARNLHPKVVPLETEFPNAQQGFGRLVLSDSVSFFGDETKTIIHRPKRGVDAFGDPEFKEGETVPQTMEICYTGPLKNGQPAKVTLVWSDYPGQPNSAQALVNDLDLRVTNRKTSATFMGNGHEDHLNNVEQVSFYEDSIEPQTTLLISVFPRHLVSAQPYSLVANGKISKGACRNDVSALSATPVITDIAANMVDTLKGLKSLVSVSFASLGKQFTLIIQPGDHKISGTSSPLAITGLPKGRYTAQVARQMEDGSSSASETVSFSVDQLAESSDDNNEDGEVQAATSFNPVITGIVDSIFTVDGSAIGHVTVSFSTGQGEYTEFQVTSHPGNFQVVGARSPLTLTNLPAGKYHFTVTSYDATRQPIGISEPSSIVEIIPAGDSLYSWTFAEWGQCSSICGGGRQTREIFCESAKDGRVDRDLCDKQPSLGPAPPAEQQCNPEACGKLKYEWRMTSWTVCSATCGGGEQRRNVYCATIDGTPMPEVFCADSPKPALKQKCNRDPCAAGQRPSGGVLTYYYQFSPCNTNCSVTCGEGTCDRHVACMIGSMEVDESACQKSGLVKPPVTISCADRNCADGQEFKTAAAQYPPPVFRWLSRQWTQCSVGCGGGTQTREVKCWSSAGHYEEESKCLASAPRPVDIHQCNNDPCPPSDNTLYQWVVGPFTPCMLDTLDKRRWVACADTNGHYHTAAKCEATVGVKPEDNKPCTEAERLKVMADFMTPNPAPPAEPSYSWVAGGFGMQLQWCKNSASQTTKKTRRALCIGTDGIVATLRDKDCTDIRPDETLEIRLPECRTPRSWHNATWSVCDRPHTPCEGTQYRKTFCVDERGEIIRDRAECVRAGLKQPANQRSPCMGCDTKQPVDTVMVPVYGTEIDAANLKKLAPTGINEATGKEAKTLEKKAAKAPAAEDKEDASAMSSLSADEQDSQIDAKPFDVSINTPYVTPTPFIKGNSASSTASVSLIVALISVLALLIASAL